MYAPDLLAFLRRYAAAIETALPSVKALVRRCPTDDSYEVRLATWDGGDEVYRTMGRFPVDGTSEDAIGAALRNMVERHCWASVRRAFDAQVPP